MQLCTAWRGKADIGGCEDHRAVRSCVVAILSLGAAANMKLILCGIKRPQSTYLPCLSFICGFMPPDNLSQKLNFSLLNALILEQIGFWSNF